MIKKILFVFGTRPEAIKFAPLIQKFQAHPNLFQVIICVTAQHREMLDQVLDFFHIQPDYDLDLMQKNQTLSSLTALILTQFKTVLEKEKPDYLFVHGDTTTTFSASLAGFYAGVTVCHVEAGLRTFNKQSPFPEELNRTMTACIANYHFAPTENTKQNLICENIPETQIVVTGNTVIDALFLTCEKLNDFQSNEIDQLQKTLQQDQKIILVTGHRRENHGKNFKNIFFALKTIAKQHPETHIIFPVHFNPHVREAAFQWLQGEKNIHLIEPLSYPAFVWLLQRTHLIITDSGGIQEEAPSLGIPVLVTRETTERPEAVTKKTVILVGSDQKKIIQTCQKLLSDPGYYREISFAHNPYGDGTACQKIFAFMKRLSIENDSSLKNG